MFLFSLIVVSAFALYVMNQDERMRLFGRVIRAGLLARDATVRVHSSRDQFHDTLRTRTPWPIVTASIVALNVGVFAAMLFGHGSIGDAETLVSWGASYGPRTTNGEWWRLLTSLFVHSGFIHLIADLAGLAMLGILLERLVGPAAFATVFAASGLFAGLAGLSSDPLAVSAGSSGAIFGLAGLLAAAAIWGFFPRSPLSIPLSALRPIAPGFALFVLYHLAASGLGSVALNGLVMGLVCGAVLARGYSASRPPALRSAGVLACTLVIAAASAFPLRGLTDVEPEIDQIVELEARSASIYEKAVEQFKLGGIGPEALVQIIDRRILPELQAARARLSALDRVPAAHRALVSGTTEYLRLRVESWKLRAEGLQKRSLPTLQRAERTERASLDVLEGVRPPEQTEPVEQK